MNKFALTLAIALSTATFSTSASVAGLATASDSTGSGSESDLYYLSWCSKENKVLTQTNTGELIEKDNCTSKGLTCQEFEVNRPHAHHIYALCQ